MSTPLAEVSAFQGVVRRLQESIAQILRTDPAALDASRTLPQIGLDSLAVMQFIEVFESEFGTEFPSVDPERLTVELLASLVGNRKKTAPAVSDPFALLFADSILPAEVYPVADSVAPADPTCILLTGATGFLGAFLIPQLLRDTSAEIVCLVRPARADAAARVRVNLERYGLWREAYHERIRAMESDQSQPGLGLSPVQYEMLAKEADVIVHAAAAVNWVQPYGRLRHPNVLAVRELLRMACLHKVKPFHYVSSLGVCYSSSGPREIHEYDDPFDAVKGIHLAYAQSKCVAERLVRTAAQRGLPATIFRPSFISGDSETGDSNTTDFIASFIKGCIHMGAAPDLDWRLDSVPVDYLASTISRLAFNQNDAPSPFRVFHLANPRPRHWRELVLWMNLFGYSIELMPYQQWLNRLDTSEVLRDLAPFFRFQPQGPAGPYLPQLYEETRRCRVGFDGTRQVLGDQVNDCPALSTNLLDRYFASFIRREFLPPAASNSIRASETQTIDECHFAAIEGFVRATPLKFSGSHSVIGELTSWRCGQTIGLHAYRVELSTGSSVDVMVKAKAPDHDVIEVGSTVARLCSPALGHAFARFHAQLGLSGCARREFAVYRQNDDRFRSHTPSFYGGRSDDRMTVLLLEKLSSMELMDSADSTHQWTRAHIHLAIEGIARIHSIWFGREESLCRQDWLGPFPNGRDVIEAKDLWVALADHSRPMFEECAPDLGGIQDSLIGTLDQWWPLMDNMPRTLIHNDFNPRNLAFRRSGAERRLCVYDWELATLGLPQHDLAELLCFVLATPVEARDLFGYIEHHRRCLEDASKIAIERKAWLTGFRLALYDLLMNRLPAYAMIHRFQRQSFLARVIRTWKATFEALPGGEECVRRSNTSALAIC